MSSLPAPGNSGKIDDMNPTDETSPAWLPRDRHVEEGSPEWVAMANAESKRVEEENNARIGRLRAEGIAVNLPGVNIVQFVTLLDMVLGDAASPNRVAFELAVQQRISAELSSVDAQTARAKLLAPGAVPQISAGPHVNGAGLIIPGR